MKKILPLIICLFIVEFSFADIRRFRCIWNDDPSTTMTIGFDQYDSNVINPLDDEGTPILYYDVVSHGQNPSDYAFNQEVDRTVDHKGMENNFVRLKNLQPATRYYFIIQDDQGVSSVMFFETSSNDPSNRLSIIAGGDSRDIPILDDDIGRQNANSLVAKLRPDAVLFGGDMTLSDDATHPIDIDEWPEWMDDWQLTIAADGRMTPIITARGNHELDNNSIYHFFDVPNSEVYYELTLGGGLFSVFTLNTEISRLGDQLTWLENTASTTCATWKVAQYHRPTRPHESDKDEQDDQANYWSPLFEEHGVQLVLESDAHLCKYTHPIVRSDDNGNAEGFIRDDQNGVLYIGEGGWGAELRTVDDDKSWTLAHGTFNQVKWLFVDQNSIEIRTILTDDANLVVAKTDADSKFTIPDGINLWNPTPADNPSGILSYNNSVLTLSNPNNTNITVDLGADIEIESGSSTTLDAGTGFDAYSWSNGTSSQTITVSTPGDYTVSVTLNGCTTTDVVTVSEIVNITPLDPNKFQFLISPNPAKNEIVAQIISTEITEMNLSIIDVEGKIIQQKNIVIQEGENNYNFNLNSFSNGIYFMVLEENASKSVQKFMVYK